MKIQLLLQYPYQVRKQALFFWEGVAFCCHLVPNVLPAYIAGGRSFVVSPQPPKVAQRCL